MTRLKVLVFGVVVLGGLILLSVGWDAGRRARRECEGGPVSDKLRVSVNTT
jgi:Zn-dependent membrane protease YugP